MASGIYKIINIINNKIYIGSANNFTSRFGVHRYDLRNNKHHNIYLQRSWNKYGEQNFKFEIIENCKNQDLLIREQYYIDTLNPEYNICKIAGSTKGRKMSEEHKKIISNYHKGRKKSKSWHISRSKYIKTKEHRENQSKALKGRIPAKHTLERAVEVCSKKVLVFFKGEFLAEYKSLIESSKQTGVHISNISKIVNGRRKQSKGFTFKLKIN